MKKCDDTDDRTDDRTDDHSDEKKVKNENAKNQPLYYPHDRCMLYIQTLSRSETNSITSAYFNKLSHEKVSKK